MSTPALNAILRERIDLAPGLALFRVAPDGWELPAFQAGQFAVLGLPGSAPRCTSAEPEEPISPPETLIRRAYSVASSPNQSGYLELFITLVQSGCFTPRLFHLKAGDRLWLGPKCSGMFTLDQVPEDSDVIMVATGTGLAPYMSMLRTYLLKTTTRRFAILLGARYSSGLGYHAELMSLHRLCKNFTYLPSLTRPEDERPPWGGAVGRIQSLWTGPLLEEHWGHRPDPAQTHIFLCGNPAMVEDMLTLVQNEGFREHSKKTPGQVHLERYW